MSQALAAALLGLLVVAAIGCGQADGAHDTQLFGRHPAAEQSVRDEAGAFEVTCVPGWEYRVGFGVQMSPSDKLDTPVIVAEAKSFTRGPKESLEAFAQHLASESGFEVTDSVSGTWRGHAAGAFDFTKASTGIVGRLAVVEAPAGWLVVAIYGDSPSASQVSNVSRSLAILAVMPEATPTTDVMPWKTCS